MTKSEKDYEVAEAARTLVKAEEIRQNKKLLSSAKTEIKKQQKAAASALSANMSKKKK